MGLDEKLFAFGHRLFKRLSAKPLPPYYEQRVELKDIETRLHLISKSLCKEMTHILEAEKIGGFSGVHFYYPKFFCPFPQKELNEFLYIQRTLFYCSAKKLGLTLPSRELSAIEKKVYTCLGVSQVLRFIRTEYPGSVPAQERISEQFQQEIQSLSSIDKNSQNGILAQWIVTILSGDYDSSSWKPVLCTDFSDSKSFLSFAEDIYKKYFSNLPLGPELSDEAFLFWGVLMTPAPSAAPGLSTDDPVSEDALAKGTEIAGKTREEIVTVNLEKAKDESNPILHSFEKVETLEEYQGGMRTQDGDDNIQDHAEALEDLKISEVTRSRERTGSIYKADIRLNGMAPDILSETPLENSGEILFYPEWDFKKKSYRPDWCRLEVRKPLGQEPYTLSELYAKERKQILKLFNQLHHQPLWQKRQRDGIELDIDALVNRHGDLHSGHSGDDRFYLRSKKQKKDWQCLLLLDNSLSTDSWVANERVLDVIKNSVGLMGTAFAQDPEAIAVAAFHSNTRHQCTYEVLKDFTDSWPKLMKNLNTVEPTGYTRIGPALRHALKTFQESSARHKFIFLLSDGKASDYDHYEGRYGMEDIKQALREARSEKVHIKCLAIEESAKYYLPQMFGAGNVQILSNPHKLPLALSSFFVSLLK